MIDTKLVKEYRELFELWFMGNQPTGKHKHKDITEKDILACQSCCEGEIGLWDRGCIPGTDIVANFDIYRKTVRVEVSYDDYNKSNMWQLLDSAYPNIGDIRIVYMKKKRPPWLEYRSEEYLMHMQETTGASVTTVMGTIPNTEHDVDFYIAEDHILIVTKNDSEKYVADVKAAARKAYPNLCLKFNIQGV